MTAVTRITQPNYAAGAGMVQNWVLELANTTVDAIQVTTKPQTEYYLGDDFDPTGMVVSALESDGTIRVLSEDEYTLDGFSSAALGNLTVIVTYNEDIWLTATINGRINAKPDISTGGIALSGTNAVVWVLVGGVALVAGVLLLGGAHRRRWISS